MFKTTSQSQDDPAMVFTLDELDRMYENYAEFCQTIKSPNANAIFEKINRIIKTTDYGTFTPFELLTYLNAVNAMHNLWITIPLKHRVKDMGTAKHLINRIDTKRLINLVPFYVMNYPRFANRKYRETNIGNLLYNVCTVLTEYGKWYRQHGGCHDDDTL